MPVIHCQFLILERKKIEDSKHNNESEIFKGANILYLPPNCQIINVPLYQNLQPNVNKQNRLLKK